MSTMMIPILFAALVAGRIDDLAAREPDTVTSNPIATTTEGDSLNRLLRGVTLELLPDQYENTKKWGQTKRIVDGVRLERDDDGKSVRIARHTKEVNHGTWTRYRIDPIDPENTLKVEITRTRESPEGGLRFDLMATADIEIFARLSEWRYGVQLYSLNQLSRARVRMVAVCDIRLDLDPSHFPPDFVVRARVNDARFELLAFELERVSQLHGALAHEMGKGARRVLEDVLDSRQAEITAKLNKSLAKQDDKTRLSLAESASSFWRRAHSTEWPARIETGIANPSHSSTDGRLTPSDPEKAGIH